MQTRKPPIAAIDWLSSVPGQAGEASLERHFSVGELASLWDLSEQTIRRMFAGEPRCNRVGAHRKSVQAGLHNDENSRKHGATGTLQVTQHWLKLETSTNRRVPFLNYLRTRRSQTVLPVSTPSEKASNYLRFGCPNGGLRGGVLSPPKYHSQASLCAIARTGCFFQSEKNSLMSFCSKGCSTVAVTMQVRSFSSPSV